MTLDALEMALRGFDRVTATVAFEHDPVQQLARLRAAFSNGYPFKSRHGLETMVWDHLSATAWSWGWYDTCAARFVELGAFPVMWTNERLRCFSHEGGGKMLTFDQRLLVLSRSLMTAARAEERLGPRYPADWPYYFFAPTTGEPQAVQAIAIDLMDRFLAGDWQSRPPFFPGCRNMVGRLSPGSMSRSHHKFFRTGVVRLRAA